MGKRKFLIDTDAGLDDTQAILMALSHSERIDIVGITTTHGNVGCEQVSRNVLRVLKMAGKLDIPVYKGASKPILGHVPESDHYHGTDGLGDVPDETAPIVEKYIMKESAVEAYITLVDKYCEELELLCLGPVTNLALAIRLYPEIGQKLKHCYIMGGNYEGHGNITLSAEFNFYCDPEAANIVLTELYGSTITLVCWELCLKSYLNWEWYHEKFTSIPSKKAQFIKTIEANTIDKFYKAQNLQTYLCCDQLIMAVALDESIVTTAMHVSASVELQGGKTRGQVVINRKCGNDKKNVKIVTSINTDLLKVMLIDAVKS